MISSYVIRKCRKIEHKTHYSFLRIHILPGVKASDTENVNRTRNDR